MKVALLTDGVHPYVIGGMQKHSYYLARELAKNKHTVYLFHCNESIYDASKLEFFTSEERAYIKSVLIPFQHKRYFPLHYIYESYLYSKSIYEALQPLLAEIDFIFAQGFCGWALLNDTSRKPIPQVAVHFHGLEMFQTVPSFKARISRYFLQQAVKKNLNGADYTLSFGGKIGTILSNLVDRSKIWEIPGGIEPSWLTKGISQASDKVRFVFIGRFERRKGVQELNMALLKLLPASNFTFDFIGAIPNEYKISHPAVKYHNTVSSETEIQKILSQCDVLVCPSYAEGMPNVIMEAMAGGLAIIATDVGAVSMLVNSDNGWLLNSPSPENITKAMEEAMKDTGLSRKKSTSQEKIRTRFLLDQVTAELIDNIKESFNKANIAK